MVKLYGLKNVVAPMWASAVVDCEPGVIAVSPSVPELLNNCQSWYWLPYAVLRAARHAGTALNQVASAASETVPSTPVSGITEGLPCPKRDLSSYRLLTFSGSTKNGAGQVFAAVTRPRRDGLT
jgi:hypothetical protein